MAKGLVAVVLMAIVFTSGCSKKKPAMQGDQPIVVTPNQNGSPNKPAKKPGTKSGINELGVMAYNVFNTFDPVHDIDERKRRKGRNGVIRKHKEDDQYLPKAICKQHVANLKKDCKGRHKEKCIKSADRKLKTCEGTDWTAEKYKMKLQTLKEVFDLHKNSVGEGRYPDIVGLVEVENDKVTQGLADLLGYEHQITSDSYDFRGIDVALMYRQRDDLVYLGHEEIQLNDIEKKGSRNCKVGKRPTRPILEVYFKFKGVPLFVYVNHWPSLANDTINRIFAARKLRRVIEGRRRTIKNAHFIALGDFNTAEYENKPAYECADKDLPKEQRRAAKYHHPFRDILEDGRRQLPPKMIDMTKETIKAGYPVAPGTYYYRNKWQDLDRFFISKNLLDGNGVDVLLESFKVLNFKEVSEVCKPRYCHTGETVPRRYNFHMRPGKEHPGYSDHYPIFMKLKIVD